ncbi:MAG: DUF1611 domain-containing protein [Pseudomonadota bacterium]
MSARQIQTVTKLAPPYALFLGTESDPTYAKTGFGLRDWCSEKCIGQIRSSDETIDLGLHDLSIEGLSRSGVKSVLIGIANVGGVISKDMLQSLIKIARQGIDIVAGLHTPLNSIDELRQASAQAGARLIDVRVPPPSLPVGTGRKRTGRRLLTVGTDCAVGKKYTALSIAKALTDHGWSADFRATGQTGIMIAGEGIPIDAVVSDFLTGAAELVSPDADPDHWDIIEGQGALHHPGYCAVSHGLLVGSQPDAFVVCHEAGRSVISGWSDFPLPSIGDVIEKTISVGQLTNPAIQCVGISVNSSSLEESAARILLADLSQRYGVPAFDSFRFGSDPIVGQLESLDFNRSAS